MNAEKKQYILSLIDKLQLGTASKIEIKFLSDFYGSYQKCKEWPIAPELREVIKERVFQNIQSKTNTLSIKHTKSIPFYKQQFFKYTVAASLILLISIGFVFNQKKSKLETTVIVESLIEIGTDKAVLTLEDGINIPLEKNKSYKTQNVSSNGEALVYNTQNKTQENAYNILTIPRGGQFFVQLSDGTKVWLNSESQLKYPVNFVAGEARNVELVYGEAYFNVSPSTNHNGDKFMLLNGKQEIEVIGTEFNVMAYADETLIYTTLVEGKIAISINENKANLVPSQQAIINPNTQEVLVKNVDVYNYISWKDGVFSFNKMPLKKIMTVLSRWYDVDIKFENKNIETLKFNGTLRKNQNIEDILDIIKNTNDLNFKIENKTLILK